MNEVDALMAEAIDLARRAVAEGTGGPFGAVVVRDGKIIARGQNRVLASGDPTAHAEVVAIRAAAASLGTFNLAGCELVASCEPCPMCLGAILWARLDSVRYGATREDAAAVGFDDAAFYEQLALPPAERRPPMTCSHRADAAAAMAGWTDSGRSY
ncbi:MAG: nucleoside deaminase [Planctomycetota bacterium]|jgi:tRNA(Arg) A34 adenosine deaminase TadA|nr:tRNA-specific adenosine deaminase [Planctomycetota bacterium]MDP6519018.1 nucleoside deaminase [Planctomycetota bacterium]MDP6839925.1 nucleoside deaminase [Planctomycetota bacterium]MDP6954720.1 nucleoside deaminase [Planctomycetota bacterium]